mmetsp:Transcript_4293/g.10336  ORF Transcript_4293/g.10336 Transcript_4293/m.10336 type:complete len:224 (-) Transcript_4293:108-779(-)
MNLVRCQGIQHQLGGLRPLLHESHQGLHPSLRAVFIPGAHVLRSHHSLPGRGRRRRHRRRRIHRHVTVVAGEDRELLEPAGEELPVPAHSAALNGGGAVCIFPDVDVHLGGGPVLGLEGTGVAGGGGFIDQLGIAAAPPALGQKIQHTLHRSGRYPIESTLRHVDGRGAELVVQADGLGGEQWPWDCLDGFVERTGHAPHGGRVGNRPGDIHHVRVRVAGAPQ